MDDQDQNDKDKEAQEDKDIILALLKRDSSEETLALMDTNISEASQYPTAVDGICSEEFSRERLFEAASCGDATQLSGLLEFLKANNKRLTSPDFTDGSNGKTALLKALLNLKDERNDTIEVLLDIAEKTADLENLINAPYKDWCYNGQTALHVAIERRSFEHVKLLVQKGADVQAKANGKFFQLNEGLGFYFGELPLSLAACTNQPDVVSFLMDNPYRRADVTDKDSQGNTVLHTLVVIADNTTENTDMITQMYNKILIERHTLQKNSNIQLEEIRNNLGLTPLKLAAKLGKIGLLRHMLHREFVDKEARPLSRKFTQWVYGPVHSSLYDTSSIDTDEDNSVLEIIVFNSEIPNRTEMLQIEPLRSLLKEKWERFASVVFLLNFLVYMIYLVIFTTVAINRKEGKPPFPIEDVPRDHLRCTGELISVLGAAWFFYKSVIIFWRNPPKFRSLYTDGFCDILFFLQATLLLLCTVLYLCGCREYVGPLVISLALAWINILYYARGTKQLGIYNVMMQRMILRDILHFLFVYGVFLFGFSAAIMSLIKDFPPDPKNKTDSTVAQIRSDSPVTNCGKPFYHDVRFTILELFKFTIGMGDLQFTDHVQYKEVFYILLILYIVLTYILLLNMLIALMGNTVETISMESENIWNLQRSQTILDMERTLPKCLLNKLLSRVSKTICFTRQQDKRRKFLRVEEMDWTQWRSDLCVYREEDPGSEILSTQSKKIARRSRWHFNQLMERIQARRHHEPQTLNP